jgi:hypothetical protein
MKFDSGIEQGPACLSRPLAPREPRGRQEGHRHDEHNPKCRAHDAEALGSFAFGPDVSRDRPIRPAPATVT